MSGPPTGGYVDAAPWPFATILVLAALAALAYYWRQTR